jgi:chorismate--pyruvate lyase
MTYNHIFKDGLVITKKLLGPRMNWQKTYSALTNKPNIDYYNLGCWLKNRKSLTNHLKDIADLRIDLITSKNKNFLLSEKYHFKSFRPESLYLREVLIYANDLPVMYARTVLPYRYLRGHWSGIKKLKSSPLSEVVYERPSIKRSTFSYAIPTTISVKKAIPCNALRADIAIARQSSFTYKKESILLSEFFFKALNKFEY